MPRGLKHVFYDRDQGFCPCGLKSVCMRLRSGAMPLRIEMSQYATVLAQKGELRLLFLFAHKKGLPGITRQALLWIKVPLLFV